MCKTGEWMNTLSQMDFELSGNGLWLFLLILLGIGFSLFIYRWTNPPVSKLLRYFLLSLRVVTLVTILCILFEPVLKLVWYRFQAPQVAVLIDDSASMRLVDASGNRAETLRQILKNPVFKKIGQKNTPEYYRFAAGLERWNPAAGDSLKLAGDGTNIQNALQSLQEKTADQYLKAIVLITDGADNLGENPVRSAATLGVPIFPIGVGDPAEPRDVLVTRVFTNQITYVNNQVPVEVSFKSAGFSNDKALVLLKQGTQTIQTRTVTLSGTSLEQTLQFHFTPAQEGVAKYQIEIPALPNEITPLNNHKDFYIKVLKSRIKILLVAGAPSADLAFLKRALAANENIEVTAFVEKRNGEFYEGQFPVSDRLEEFDAVILQDFPRPTSDAATVENLCRIILKKEMPLLFLAGPAVDFRKLAPVQNLFPFKSPIAPGKEYLIQINLTTEGNTHPVLRMNDDLIQNNNLWRELPPVYFSALNLKPTALARTLIEVDKDRSKMPASLPPQPVLALSQAGSHKMAAIMAFGLWRWEFLLKGLEQPESIYPTFFNKLVRWLVTREESKRVRIQLEKDIFRGGEPVQFKAEVYTEDYRPLDDAEVRVLVKNSRLEQELILTGRGNGKYEGTLQVLEGGEYQFFGQANSKGQVAGTDSGRFSIEPFSLEFQNTRMEADMLQKMATTTNGRYFSPDDLAALPELLEFPPRRTVESREWELWNKWALLGLIVAFLSMEWFLRKKKGML
jgi:hypothetical protein